MPERGYFVKTVNRIEVRSEEEPRKLRVAAYARVSLASELSEHSLAAQIRYYSGLIQRNPAWEFAGIYADNGISGTATKNRAEFNRMLADAEAGRIDVILTKSIQRFARNTVDLLKTVRHLKELGIEVRFERENIHTLSGDGELMLSILASFAQEESRSLSENVRWSVKKHFEQGKPWNHTPIYGYQWEGDQLCLIPEEAEIVRQIYRLYLDGTSISRIRDILNELGSVSKRGRPWSFSTVRNVLTNYSYTGNLLLHKTFRADPITKEVRVNKGEMPQYLVEGSHDAIISMEEWQQVQDSFQTGSLGPKQKKKDLPAASGRSATPASRKQNRDTLWDNDTVSREGRTCFSSKIWCQNCQCMLHRSQKKNSNVVHWFCAKAKRTNDHDPCPIPNSLPEYLLKPACASVLGLEEFGEAAFQEKVNHIEVTKDLKLLFFQKDGRQIVREGVFEGRRSNNRPSSGAVGLPVKYYPFTKFLFCANCGAVYHRYRKKLKDGTVSERWICNVAFSDCCHRSIRESTLEQLVAEVLGLPTFDAAAMEAQLEKATMDGNKVTFHFRDEHTVKKEFDEPHTNGWTPERRARFSEQITQSWRERKCRNQ